MSATAGPDLPTIYRPTELIESLGHGFGSKTLFADGRNEVGFQEDLPEAPVEGRVSPGFDEFWIVASGSYTVSIGDTEPFEAGYGDIVYCPSGLPQTIRANQVSHRFTVTCPDGSTEKVTHQAGKNPLPDREQIPNRLLLEREFMSELSLRQRKHTVIAGPINHMVLIRETPGTQSKAHWHFDFDEWWYIPQGRLSYEVGTNRPRLEAQPGDIVFVPLGFRHSITTLAGEDSLRMPVTTPESVHIYEDGDAAAPSPRE